MYDSYGYNVLLPFGNAKYNTTLMHMDLESVASGTQMAPLNETDAPMKWRSVYIPRFLYKELPAVLFVTGILLNILLIVYFVKSKRYKNPLFTILTGLAVMDTFVCIGGAMYSIFLYPVLLSRASWFICPPSAFMGVLGPIGSEYTLLLFTGVRLYQAVYPLQARALVTVGKMVKCCIAIPLLSSVYAIWFVANVRLGSILVDGEKLPICYFAGNLTVLGLGQAIVVMAVPCWGIVSLHIAKYCAYMKSNVAMVDAHQERKNPDGRAIAIVIATFYICWVPSAAYMVAQHFGVNNFKDTQDYLFLVLMYVTFANSMVNPIVYVLAMKSIRDDVFALVFSKQKK